MNGFARGVASATETIAVLRSSARRVIRFFLVLSMVVPIEIRGAGPPFDGRTRSQGVCLRIFRHRQSVSRQRRVVDPGFAEMLTSAPESAGDRSYAGQ